MEYEYAFEMAASNIRFGLGASQEVGMDLAELDVKLVMVLTDPEFRKTPVVDRVLKALEEQNIAHEVFDRVRVEPTDASMMEAVDFARSQPFDGFVAVGGGSTIDTAKVANLYSTYPPDDFLDYVNPPIGKGLPVPGALKPLFALPTTAGTGSETTGVAIFDLERMRAKTGIAHRRLKPTLGIIDPENTATLPPMVAAATGLDVLTHAVESYTAIPFNKRPRPEHPILRPAYQGSNPISDIWALEAMRMVAKFLIREVENPDDVEARSMMALAASFAGVGFGNAGVTLPHGMSYPVSGMVRDFRAEGYPRDHAMVPHGIAVVLNAPAAFRFTAPGCPDRHLRAAQALGADISGLKEEDAGEILADTVIGFMKRLGIPNGLNGVGYTVDDIPKLVEGTLPQHRVIKIAPRKVGPEELNEIFADAMRYW
ncbi:MAG: iron-containing alcohol dehydrogenase [Deltaproteobacteria bacterium]|nr:iron-containing alcohol dehydrogenase [Deltaproteobacteria bacterium]MBW2047499.1 iron-containing alcohol dehydrogenase [Deltaproteobacteria bacterium]MBW2111725.1 iron-containing alcohol dehydrogenase [Deltaproteobacteria bacterium]